jgi:hypothetical protein
VVALALRARITLHRFLTGLAVHAWRFIIVIKRTWGGQLREHRINGGPGLGVEQTMDAAHPIDALPVNRQVSAPGPLGVVRQIAVLVEQQRQPVGCLTKLRRPQASRDPRQISLGGLPSWVVDMAR